jgi:hypothetical protein
MTWVEVCRFAAHHLLVLEFFQSSSNSLFFLAILKQFCGAETFCFCSGSDFQKVLAPVPALAPTLALYL